MGKQYTIPFSATIAASGGDVDLFEVAPVQGRRIRIVGLRIGKLGEVVEGSENVRRITLRRLTGPLATPGSGGAAGVPVGISSAADDPEFAVEVNNSTVAIGAAAGATDRVADELAWNVRVGGEFNLNLVLKYPDVAVIRLEESLDEYEADFGANGALVVEEAVGGYD